MKSTINCGRLKRVRINEREQDGIEWYYVLIGIGMYVWNAHGAFAPQWFHIFGMRSHIDFV